MSGDGGGDSDSDSEKGGGFGGFADAVTDTLSELSDRAGQMGREAAAREEAAKSMGSAGISNLSGMDTFSPSTGRSTSTAASSSATSRGTSGQTSGFGIDSPGRDNWSDGFTEAMFSPEPISSRSNMMETFSPVAASSVPSATSPASTAAMRDTMTYAAPRDSQNVSTMNAYTDPAGYEVQATERAGRFSSEPLGVGTPEYDLSTPLGIAQMAYGKFRDAGYTHEQAVGVLGNIQVESLFNPSILGDNRNAYGLFQHNDRAPQLMEFAAKKGTEWSDPETQVEFALHELETTEQRAAAALKSATTPSAAARAFANTFERPNPASSHMGRRTSAADHFANEFANLETPTSPNTFSGNMNVALAPAGVELDTVDLPGSRAFASNQTAHATPTPNSKPGTETQFAELDNAVGPLSEKMGSYDAPVSTVAGLMEALGAPTQTTANTSVGRLETAYLDPGPRSVQTQTISVSPTVEQAAQAPASPAPTVNPHPETSFGRLETVYLEPEVRSVQTTTIPGSQSAAPETTVSTNTAPAATNVSTAPEEVETRAGLNNTAKTVIGTGIDVAVGAAVPPVGIYNAAATAVNAGANLLGFDNVNVPTVGSLVVGGMGNIDFGSGGTAPQSPTETDPIEFASLESETPEEPSQEVASENLDDDPVARLETRYLSPYPTPAERWGPNARQYRGA